MPLFSSSNYSEMYCPHGVRVSYVANPTSDVILNAEIDMPVNVVIIQNGDLTVHYGGDVAARIIAFIPGELYPRAFALDVEHAASLVRKHDEAAQ